ncbi:MULTISPECIES: PfkB family carbohydrate kinase [unclassified Mesorhizobium]|uniref:PfkB family carbohydrate kinase n=1 Tax=unclassified Mesorhizobium TaxID=325217 RepID=UPI000BB002A4|nr:MULTISPECIES: PfkB family carbohydrate kinase [unclassified Mesorhizobium]TGT56698.1 carbohydrate kinase family protein [Mesorhizobium sp. M00.F.Ca.ET.170.01.1.1]AZO13153.1 carbohydrate kinase family protein [Mesorhizobium sp. M3A.F.Ca.ET.080.04.2.1]PBB86916.1 carbohydrate kinase [Mesorhizobium sp. WSM3876]RWB72799.1 MAG: carbohydrate kinase family protein [Mesorhizobium sp.]RWB87112.1 MAG: carbohydrate kinase family protein [Mesorhizobium sp.]
MRPLAVIGNVNVDLIVGPVAPWPKAGTETVVEHDDLRVGGQAGNTALAWQALGIDFDIAANLGDDQFGRWLREAFGSRAETWPVHPEGTTLSVGMTHPDGERTFFTTRGHLPRFSLGDVLAVLDGNRLSGGYALLTGSFLTDDLTQQYAALFDWADQHQIAVALDTGWPMEGWTAANCAAARAWLSRSDLALFNEVETTTLASLRNPAQAAREIRHGMKERATVVVKRGPEGALAIGPDGQIVEMSAPRVTVVDTIGAGDVFNAAFLAALAQERPLASCLSAATRVASRAISTLPRDYGGPMLFEEAVNERA